MGKIYFTVEEARELLQEIKPKLRKLMECHVKLRMQDHISVRYEEPFDNLRQSAKEARQWYKGQHEFYTLLVELLDKGVYVKDPSKGLIDFFSKYQGREIFLCYHFSEETIEYWHELEEGFVSRKSVAMLETKQIP